MKFNIGDSVYVLRAEHGYDGHSGPAKVLRADGDDYLVEMKNREVWFHRQRLMPPREHRGWIVVAWTITARRTRRWSEPHTPSVIETTVPRACVWLRRGNDDDATKAETWIQKAYPETGRMLRYPPEVRDPLVLAKRDIVAAC